MKTVLHKASSRGFFNHGWLKTHHTFSFADYYDPERVHFGALRVLNDDIVAPDNGFGLHPHSNMEIVTIPLHGKLTHGDSMGHSETIESGMIQVMSAGRGLRHSEMNKEPNRDAELLQIWVIPDRENVEPRYVNAVIGNLLKENQITAIVEPYPGNGTIPWIYQQAWFSVGELEKGTELTYKFHSPQSYGVYVFMISGTAEVAGVELSKRDGLGVSDTQEIGIKAVTDTHILLIEVPEVK